MGKYVILLWILLMVGMWSEILHLNQEVTRIETISHFSAYK